MEFLELIEKRRSCRDFDPTPIPAGEAEGFIQAGCWAPSPLNLQPWEFVVVTESSVKAEVRRVSEEARQAVLDHGGPSWAGKYGMDFIDHVPLMVAVAVNKKKGGLGEFFGQPHGACQAGSACVQNIMLAAAEKGYDSLWFTFFDPDRMGTVLGLPENLELVGLVFIGNPAAPVQAPPRKAPRIHRQHYGQA